MITINRNKLKRLKLIPNQIKYEAYIVGSSKVVEFEIAEIEDGFYSIAVAGTNKWMEAEDMQRQNGTQVGAYPAHGMASQRWAFELLPKAIPQPPVQTGIYTITNKLSATCLEIRETKPEGAEIVLWEQGVVVDRKRWKITHKSSDARGNLFTIQNVGTKQFMSYDKFPNPLGQENGVKITGCYKAVKLEIAKFDDGSCSIAVAGTKKWLDGDG